MKAIRYAVVILPLLVIAMVLHYSLPQVDVVRIVGTDTKRMAGTAESSLERDIYYIQTETLEGNAPRVYRNEDNWLYFKFASADLQTRARSLAQQNEIVAVRHYGYRIPLVSAFPNALSIRQVEPDHSNVPVFNIVVILALFGVLFLIRRPILRFLGFGGGGTPATERTSTRSAPPEQAPPAAPREEPSSDDTARRDTSSDDVDDWLDRSDGPGDRRSDP